MPCVWGLDHRGTGDRMQYGGSNHREHPPSVSVSWSDSVDFVRSFHSQKESARMLRSFGGLDVRGELGRSDFFSLELCLRCPISSRLSDSNWSLDLDDTCRLRSRCLISGYSQIILLFSRNRVKCETKSRLLTVMTRTIHPMRTDMTVMIS